MNTEQINPAKLSIEEKRKKANEIVQLLAGLSMKDALEILRPFAKVQIEQASIINGAIIPEPL